MLRGFLSIILCTALAAAGCAQFDSEGSALGYLLLNGGTSGGAGSSAWDADGWSRRRQLTVNATTIGSNLSNLPVLVRLDSTRIDYSETQGSGADLRFYDESGNLLSHEIESWNSGGTSILWVKYPALTAGSGSGYINMYYGNSAAADGQAATGVWSESYNLVLHLSETTGNGGTRSDSSGTVTAGTFTDTDGDSNPAAAGRIGTADDFAGDADSINMGNQAAFALTTFTITGWFQTTCPAPFCTIITRNLNQTNRNYYLGIWDGAFVEHTTGELALRTSSGGAVDIDLGSVTVLNDGAWHYFAAVLDGSTQALLYVDGGTAQTQAAGGTADQPAASVVVGHDNFSGGSRYFAGSLDEIRLSSVARSADWIAAQYLSQTDALLTFGAEETR